MKCASMIGRPQKGVEERIGGGGIGNRNQWHEEGLPPFVT